MIEGAVKDISFKDLRLSISSGEIDLSSLNIFKEKKEFFKELDLEIRAAVIGTSHFVQFRRGDSIFTEILACDADKNFGGKRLFMSSIEKIQDELNCDQGGFSYKFDHQLEDLKNDNYKGLAKDSELFLEYEFNADSELPSAKTIISIQKLQNSFHIRTAHEYHEENITVWSNSKVTVSC